MNKKIIVIITAIVFLVSLFVGFIWFGLITQAEETEIEKFNVLKIEEFNDENLEKYTLEELKEKINIQKEKQKHAHEVATAARKIGWPEDCETIKLAQIEWSNAQVIIMAYQKEYDKQYDNSEQRFWDVKMLEYPEATQTWLFMKELGWNDQVCAGIMGNLMAEVGGQTLKLRPNAWGGSYYGICQWGPGYPEIWDAPLEDQLLFLEQTIKYEFDTYGGNYKFNFNFDSFLSITNEKEAAIAFAKCYERCASKSYEVRKNNATKAYNYFVG